MKKDIINKNTAKKISSELKTKRVPTGIINLDGLIEGGFEKNSTNFVIGDNGSGKTIFGIQFLMQGINLGEKCLYITFEEKKKDFYSNMESIGFDLEGLENEGKFFFLEYTPGKVKTMLEEGGGAVESIVLGKKIKRIVIDSMTSFGLLFENDLEKRESLLSLFNILKKWNCTTILTYGSESYDKKIAPDILEPESDSVIILYFVMGEKGRERYLEVLKMRGTKHSSQIYKFSIKKNGIALDPNPVSRKIVPD